MDCDTLRISALRLRLPEPNAPEYRLPSGTVLMLHRVACMGRGAGGHRLLADCPGCGARVTLLRRPPGGSWACWRCQPVSHQSWRRSGAPKGRRKPRSWRLAQINDAQSRLVRLLGLAGWPPGSLWGLDDLRRAPRKADAPPLSLRRRDALERRLDAYESLRVAELVPMVLELMGQPESAAAEPAMARRLAHAKATLRDTRWAVRRQARDPRTLRRLDATRAEPFTR
jgi:hypothetical protein